MTTRTRHPIRGGGREPTYAGLLDSPLDFIAGDHLRTRAVCAEMQRLAQSEAVDPAETHPILDFMLRELPALIRDEDEDLLPLLVRRSEPDDDMPRMKARLEAEHRHVMALVPAVTSAFQHLAQGAGALGGDDRDHVARFAKHMRRHLIFENAIILPFARLRLTAQDLATLRLRMRGRRGLPETSETASAG